MNKLTLFILSGTLLFAGVGCDVARTSGDAPDSVDEEAVVEEPTEVEETLDDATSEVRQEQLDSDIRAREERNEVLGDEQVRDDSDLESEIRAKLEANIPRSKLTVEAEDGFVKIVGTVPSEKEYESIMPLAQEIKGVDEVNVDVEVMPSTES